jgi:NADH:ubiquinone oxidoreductase subunit 5 (subunit L)/multisubunit Na+/H+ antiporter MnhA subunit
MTLLVLSGSWVTLFLGWELIGITSFLLINFWSSKITTLKSAIKALSFNKISDAAIMAAVCLNLSAGTFYFNGSLAYANALASRELDLGFASLDYASLLLFVLMIASFCKSAQFGFHFWLPDSMEAPVPASALIHSATLVSAGIYAMLRFNALFETSPMLSSLFAGVTAFTAFYGAIIAGFQTDVKKILAYSTISHCGMLMFSVLMHQPYVTLFYLFAHGFFKSLNFMCVGNFIQHSNNYQDVSRMGRFFTVLSFERNVFAVTLFNLSSAPMFFCFFSKH